MAEFEQLQELWQHQPELNPSANAQALTGSLRVYGRRLQRVYAAKLVLMVAVLGWGIWSTGKSLWVASGFAVVGVLALLLMWWDWRRQRAFARLDFAEPSVAFVRGAIAQLLEQREPFRRYYWPFVLSLAAALNLLSSAAPWSRPWYWHGVDTALPFGFYEFGKWIRMKRFDWECGSMLERLREMLAALEERSS